MQAEEEMRARCAQYGMEYVQSNGAAGDKGRKHLASKLAKSFLSDWCSANPAVPPPLQLAEVAAEIEGSLFASASKEALSYAGSMEEATGLRVTGVKAGPVPRSVSFDSVDEEREQASQQTSTGSQPMRAGWGNWLKPGFLTRGRST